MDVQQGGKERAEYGRQIIKKLSDRISETLFTEFALKKSQTVFPIFEQEEPFIGKYKRKGATLMESRVEQAAERKMCGYNCAQAVACTYCDLAGIDEETARNLTQGFAVGIGGSMEATCGAIIGAVNILGLINKNPQRTMQGSRKIINRFKEQNGTVICKELKGITDGVVKRECVDCVRDAAAFLEAELPDMTENYVSSEPVED